MIETHVLSRAELENRFSSAITLAEVIHRVEEECKGLGRVICSVKVNGKRLTEDEEVILGHTKLSELEWIEFESEEPCDLIEGTLKIQQQMLERLKEHAGRTATAYRDMKFELGMGRLVALLEGCHHLTEGLVALKAVRGAMKLDLDSSWPKAEQDFRDVVQSLLSAIEKRDNLMVADLLEFDFAHALDQWAEILEKKSDNLAK